MEVRRAVPGDAAACARILNRWIDDRDWMPRVHPVADVERHYREFVLPNREVWVAGIPVLGYLAYGDGMVTSLYVAEPGRGIGKRLLDRAKVGRDVLELWTFVANTGARRFYAREGFSELRQTDGSENEEGLPDVLLRWERAA